MSPRMPLALALSASLLLAGACSSDDGDDAADPTTTTTTTEAETSGRDLEADRELASGALLRLSDLPTGWEATPDDGDDDDDDSEAFAERFAQCTGIDEEDWFGAQDDDDRASVDSPDFENADDETVAHTVSVAEDAARAERAFGVLQLDATPGCLTEAFGEMIRAAAEEEPQEGFSIGEITVNELSFPSLAQRTAAFRATVPVAAQGVEVELYLDMIFVQAGRMTSVLMTQGVVEPFDPALAEELATTAADRLDASA